MKQAFILGAGLGNRLRPLTSVLPKPLVPLFHKPLTAWTIEACSRVGAVRFAINTHHLPDAWNGFEENRDITFFHEQDLLETGGGLKNIGPWMNGEPVLVHNGDIFSTMPLDRLVAAHEASGLPVTLALRSEGVAQHIAIDATGSRVTDIRRMLDTADGTHVFSGVYCVNPEFLDLIPDGEKISVIPAFLELAKAGKLGAVVLDDGVWLDLGDRESYLEAHRVLHLDKKIHPTARISENVTIENSVVGPHAKIGTGSIVKNSVIWPGATVAAGADLDGCIIYSDAPVEGSHRDADL